MTATVFDLIEGWETYSVNIMNNYYTGKWCDYSNRLYFVIASSPEEAVQIVLMNADAVLEDLKTKRLHNGRLVLPKAHAMKITEKRVSPGKQFRISTAHPKSFFTPRGVMDLKVKDGKIEVII